MPNADDPHEHVTDVHELKPERETLPPTAASEPPVGFNPPPSAALMRLAGFDPDQFLHAALLAAADGAHESRENRKDVGALIEAAVSRLDVAAETRSAMRTREIKADFALTNREVQKLAVQVGDLTQTVREKVLPWMGKVDGRLESGDERFVRIELDMAAMRSQMDRLDRELAILKGIQDATGAATQKTD